ncbi:hypothetical protein GUJ93_ZPchr0012g20319 [Zizania palustris]|uniref:Uncharacterized protein n=1 Tax=Zizania palustris TaxID=103762 RepID=A0A8J6BWJ6_ZIZPA|nr:hypothetical protein GUJ93_ZPchr0012g20319 [Zizania palustris]
MPSMVAEAPPSNSSCAIWSRRRDEITFDRLHKVDAPLGSAHGALLGSTCLRFQTPSDSCQHELHVPLLVFSS